MQANKPIFLIVGLGNPGPEYERTRHNVGFMAADEIHRRYNFSTFRAKFDGLIAEGNIEGEKVYLLKPQTFMNLSGTVRLDAVLFADTRTKVGGSSAGHNGIKSIDSAIGREYRRIRIGIGHPRDLGLPIDAADWVLGKFTPAEMSEIHRVIEDIQL